MNTALEVAPRIGIGVACLALGVARATLHPRRAKQGHP